MVVNLGTGEGLCFGHGIGVGHYLILGQDVAQNVFSLVFGLMINHQEIGGMTYDF
jgi:hypothetical protein